VLNAKPLLWLAQSITNLILVIPHLHIISDDISSFHKHPRRRSSPHMQLQEAGMGFWKSTHFWVCFYLHKSFIIICTFSHSSRSGLSPYQSSCQMSIAYPCFLNIQEFAHALSLQYVTCLCRSGSIFNLISGTLSKTLLSRAQ
jgi:hypothetical protein